MGERWADRGPQLARLSERRRTADSQGPADRALLDFLLVLGEVLDPDLDDAAARQALDGLVARIAEDPSPRGVVRALSEKGFGGAGRTFLSWRNSSPAHTLVAGSGLPLTLGLITVVAAAEAGVSLDLIGLPFHVVVGCPTEDGPAMGESFSGHDTYIDALVPSLCDRTTLEQIVERNSRGRLSLDPSMLAVMTAGDVIARVMNNLENAANAGRDLPLLGLVRVIRAVIGSQDAPDRSGAAARHLLN